MRALATSCSLNESRVMCTDQTLPLKSSKSLLIFVLTPECLKQIILHTGLNFKNIHDQYQNLNYTTNHFSKNTFSTVKLINLNQILISNQISNINQMPTCPTAIFPHNCNHAKLNMQAWDGCFKSEKTKDQGYTW